MKIGFSHSGSGTNPSVFPDCISTLRPRRREGTMATVLMAVRTRNTLSRAAENLGASAVIVVKTPWDEMT